MHYFLTICFIFLSVISNAAVYYVSSSGNDSNPGTHPDQPWQSLAKVNSFFPRPGDQILFKRGDSWTGTLTVRSSGTSNNPIVYGTYGSGDKPIIYGSEPITGWTLHSGNIWKASVNRSMAQLFVDTARMKIARHPNSGYLNICSTRGAQTLSCTTLDQNINYKGAKWTGRTNEWSLMTQTVLSSNGQQLLLDAEPSAGLKVGNGFYLLNKLEFLDAPGEWYYDNSSKTVYLWTPTGQSPEQLNVRGSTNDDIISVNRKNHITISNLDLMHPAERGVNAHDVSYLTLDNLRIFSPEMEGILITDGDSHHNVVTHCEVDGANHHGIKFWSSYSLFENNKITNTAMFNNLGLTGMSGFTAGRGIDVNGTGNVLRYNVIINCGYLGIGMYKAPNTTIEYNYIKNTCLVKDDGGAIYMWEENVNNEGCSGTVIRHNIIDSAVGTREGLNPIYKVQGYGIYLDDNSKNITVENNTVVDCGGANIFLHLNRNCNVSNNTAMGAIRNVLVRGDKGNNRVSGNTLYATEVVGSWQNPQNVEESDGRVSFNNNKYIAHYSSKSFRKEHEDYSFSGWKSRTGQDANSTFDGSALKAGEVEELFYNETKQTKKISLGKAVYRDLDGNEKSGFIELEPFKSIILIKTNKTSNHNQNPDVKDQSFHLPPNPEPNTYIGKVAAFDPDTGQTLEFTMQPESELFFIDAISGEIYVKKKLHLTHDTTIVLSIVVTDNGNPPSSATASITINFLKPIPVFYTEDISICEGETYQNWMASGKYERVLQTTYGADSIVTTNLRVNPTKYTTETISIHAGESYLGWTHTGTFNRILTSSTGCDSIVTTKLTVVESISTTENITICEGESYQNWSEQGQYQRVLTAASGADSIVITNLWVQPIHYTEEEISIVQGESYEGWFEAGEYQRTLTSASGCDSIITTVLTVLPSPTVEDIYICAGSSYLSWNSEGQYQRTLKSASGADSIVITNLWVHPQIQTTESITIKEGESYNGWTKSGVYQNSYPSSTGCDSTVVTNMTVLKSVYQTEEVSICEGSQYHNWSQSGQYQRTLTASSGADSVVTTLLWVEPAIKTSETISINTGESYLGWSESGTYNRTLTTAEGCDSIVTTILNVIDINPGGGYTEQSIELRKGWNLISSYVLPENPDMAVVQKDLVSCNSLICVQDQKGRTFEKWNEQIGWINSIGDMRNNEGYRVYVRNNCALTITGQPASLPLSISLKKGWNLVAFPYTEDVNSMAVLKQLIDARILIKAQDEVGYSLEYWGRSFGWMNRLGNFRPGEGYLVKVKEAATLTINPAYEKSTQILAEELPLHHFERAYYGNGFNHMNIHIQDLNESGFQPGDEIAAFDNDVCVGAIKLGESDFANNVASIIVSEADRDSSNGFTEGNPIELRLWNSALNKEQSIQAEIINGEMVFSPKASVFISVAEQLTTGVNQQIPIELTLYPNPATDRATIRFSKLPLENARISVYDLTGKQLISRDVLHTEEILDIQNFKPGMYLVKTSIGNQFFTKKLMVQ